MKQSYILIIWGLILPLLASKTLAASVTPSAKDKLIAYYENELELFAKEFAEKAKNISVKMLQDPNIQLAKTPLMREFKNNITEYLDDYEVYKHFDLYNEMLTQFITTTMEYYQQEPTTNKDYQYILKLLRKLNYDELCDKYEVKFPTFIKEKFLPKIEELGAELMPDSSKQSRNLMQWYNDVKECQNYKCLYTYMQNFENTIITPIQRFLAYLRDKFENMFMYYSYHTYSISKAVINDTALSQLSPNIREHFTNDMQVFIISCENNHDIRELYNLMLLFRHDILERYYDNKDIKKIYQEVFKTIFQKHGLAQFKLDYIFRFNLLVDTEISEKYHQLKMNMDADEFEQHKPFIGRFEHIMHMKNQTQRVQHLEMIYRWV